MDTLGDEFAVAIHNLCKKILQEGIKRNDTTVPANMVDIMLHEICMAISITDTPINDLARYAAAEIKRKTPVLREAWVKALKDAKR